MIYCAIVFDRIPGHSETIAGLRAAQDSDRVSHAWLFSGPDGVGKRNVALAFAQRLNCKHRSEQPNQDACGTCRTCRQLSDGRHPDLITLSQDGQFIKIAQVREAMKSLRFAPIDAAYRVILIQDADRLHEAAANALLKTLEEPAPRNVFLLLTSRPAAVLATIRSRCQQVRFRSLTRATVTEWLMSEHSLSQADAEDVAGVAGGSLTAAQLAMDEAATSLREEWIGYVAELPRANPTRLLELAERLGANKTGIPNVLDILRLIFRDAMLRSVHVESEKLTFRSKAEFLSHLQPTSAVSALRYIDDADNALHRNINPRMLAEHLIFGLRHSMRNGRYR